MTKHTKSPDTVWVKRQDGQRLQAIIVKKNPNKDTFLVDYRKINRTDLLTCATENVRACNIECCRSAECSKHYKHQGMCNKNKTNAQISVSVAPLATDHDSKKMHVHERATVAIILYELHFQKH